MTSLKGLILYIDSIPSWTALPSIFIFIFEGKSI
jgi:hypothetical protein